ncbi:glycosyltransferase family 4 protein [Patescibacteria group bacterium]|nr:glycosyltransferase family 4 protein [Patescibacteria group bacterium]
MKIVIDISPLRTGHKTRGIGMYTRRLVKALHEVDKKNQYILTTKLKEIEHAELIHYPYFDLFFHTLPIKKQTKTVITIHDVIPLIFPSEFPVGIRGRIHFVLQRLALRDVNAVITDSKNSKKDIIKLLRVDPTIVHVVPLAAAKQFRPQKQSAVKRAQKKYKLPEKFILYVGDVNPNKNLIRLLDAFAEIALEFPDVHLVLVGRAFADKRLREVLAIHKKIEKNGLQERVHIRSEVPLDPKDDLAAIYTAATAYVQPSLYEGFGLPILEAFACETPVVAASVSSIPEVTGNAAISVDPHKTESISSGLKKVLTLSPLERRKLIAKGKSQAKKFSWKDTARRTIGIYEAVLEESRRKITDV